MNTATLRHYSISIASLFYLYTLTAIANTVEFFQNSLVHHRNAQHNAVPVWIVVLIVLIVGGLVLAGLMWACKKYGGGRSFAGEFKVLGAYAKIKCS